VSKCSRHLVRCNSTEHEGCTTSPVSVSSNPYVGIPKGSVFVVHPLGSKLSVDCMQLAEPAGRCSAQGLLASIGCTVQPRTTVLLLCSSTCLPGQTLAVSASARSRHMRLVQPNATHNIMQWHTGSGNFQAPGLAGQSMHTTTRRQILIMGYRCNMYE
jgi:hypothetical protein